MLHATNDFSANTLAFALKIVLIDSRTPPTSRQDNNLQNQVSDIHYTTQGGLVLNLHCHPRPNGTAIDLKSRLSISLCSSVRFAKLENANDYRHQG